MMHSVGYSSCIFLYIMNYNGSTYTRSANSQLMITSFAVVVLEVNQLAPLNGERPKKHISGRE